MKLIAVVGMTGSGKSEFTNFFLGSGYSKIRFGDVRDQIIKEKGLALNEENERSVRENLRKQYGMDAYAKLNLMKIEEALQRHNVVIDGLYSWEEYKFLKEKFGKKLIVIALFAPPSVRYERLVDREVRPLTKEQAHGRDKVEIENLNKAAPIAMADYTILNTGTLFDLKEGYEEFIEWMIEESEK